MCMCITFIAFFWHFATSSALLMVKREKGMLFFGCAEQKHDFTLCLLAKLIMESMCQRRKGNKDELRCFIWLELSMVIAKLWLRWGELQQPFFQQNRCDTPSPSLRFLRRLPSQPHLAISGRQQASSPISVGQRCEYLLWYLRPTEFIDRSPSFPLP